MTAPSLPFSPKIEVGGGILVVGIHLKFDIWYLEFGAFLLFSLIGKSFVNQHHRDIVLNGIEQATGFADQSISLAIQENVPLTFRTSQNLQKLFTDWHLHSPFLISGEAREAVCYLLCSSFMVHRPLRASC
jgi:hypothetical protein